MTWRYHAFRTAGAGERPVAWDLPLTGVTLTDDLSGPGGLDATITPEIARLKEPNGDPVFVPWSTIIYAEESGQIRGAGILETLDVNGPGLDLGCRGLAGYLAGLPHTGEYSKIAVDPLDVARYIWEYAQGFPNSNLGITVDTTTSPVRIGEPERTNEFTTSDGQEVSFDSGPYKLNAWTTDDLGKELDDLAAETPFEYRMEHRWDGDTPRHHLRLGYPTLGTRKTGLRFVLGENITTTPTINYAGEEYASDVLVRGAGEGRDMITGHAWRSRTGRLRRVHVLADKSLRSRTRAQATAETEVARALGEADLTQITIRDHPNAPTGSYRPGDHIHIQIPAGWHDRLDLWVRILSLETRPAEGTVTATVERSDKQT